ncbi:Midasin [Colletotrichum viniferum]|nr:Midasin [Colletotrichum viniferum]
MKFAFAATLLLTAISGVAAVGWPSNAGYYHGSEGIVLPGPWDEPDARSKCKYSRGRQVGGGRRSRFHIRIKDFKGDAGSFCHRFWENLRRWGLICTPNSYETWKPFCGMEEGDLAWRFENSVRCNEGMVASTFWEVTQNEWGGILCRDYAVDEQDGACAHCPLMSEPFWAHTIYDKFKDDKKDDKKDVKKDVKKSDVKDAKKSDVKDVETDAKEDVETDVETDVKEDDASADDLDDPPNEDVFDDKDISDDDFFEEDPFDDDFFKEDPFADDDFFKEDPFDDDFFKEDPFADDDFFKEDPLDDDFFKEDPFADDDFFKEDPLDDDFFDEDLSDAFVNLDEDDEKKHEGLIGKEFRA